MAKEQISEMQVGVAQQHFNIGSMRRLMMPLMARSEQLVLLATLKKDMQAIERVHRIISASESRMDGLHQSILAKAFRGELVPQDPNDEPASVLLARIKAARASEPKPARRGGRRAS